MIKVSGSHVISSNKISPKWNSLGMYSHNVGLLWLKREQEALHIVAPPHFLCPDCWSSWLPCLCLGSSLCQPALLHCLINILTCFSISFLFKIRTESLLVFMASPSLPPTSGPVPCPPTLKPWRSHLDLHCLLTHLAVIPQHTLCIRDL